MEISITANQELFVLSTRGSVSCLGFSVVYKRLTELNRRLLAAGQACFNAAATPTAIGTLEQLTAYQQALQAYQQLGDSTTWYDSSTPKKVQNVLERYRKSGRTLRVFYGDAATGRDWLEEFDTIGTVGRSAGYMKVPLLCCDADDGGHAIRPDSVVRLIDPTSGQELYRAATYHLPSLEIADSDEPEVPYGVWATIDGDLRSVANFTSYAKAAHYVAFISGETHSRPA